MNYLNNHEVAWPIKTEFVIENLNIYEIQIIANDNAAKHKIKGKEMVNKYEVFYYPNVFGLD